MVKCSTIPPFYSSSFFFSFLLFSSLLWVYAGNRTSSSRSGGRPPMGAGISGVEGEATQRRGPTAILPCFASWPMGSAPHGCQIPLYLARVLNSSCLGSVRPLAPSLSFLVSVSVWVWCRGISSIHLASCEFCCFSSLLFCYKSIRES